MAENEEAEEELSSGEAAELEALLDDPEGENKKSEAGLKDKVKKVFSKKALVVFGVGFLLLVGAGTYILLLEDKEKPTDVEEKAKKKNR